MYQRPDKSYFQELQELESLIITCILVQKFLSKQADINKIFKIIHRKVLKGTHLPVIVREIKAGYLVSSYLIYLCLYLAQNKLPNTKTAIQKGRNVSREIYLTRFFTFQNHYTS